MPTDAPAQPVDLAAAAPPAPPRGKVRGTLGGRIALVTTIVALLTAATVAAVSVPQIQAAAQSEGQQYLSRTADTLSGALDTGGNPFSQLSGRAQSGVQSGQIQVQFVSPGGQVPDYLSPANVSQLTSSGTLSTVVQTESGPLYVEGRVLAGGAALLMTEPQSVAGLNVGRDIARLLLALAIGVAIAIISGLILARRLARPLKSAAVAADQMAHGRRDVVIVPEGPQEVAEVADSLNGLNRALAVSEARQREFLLSVSHELRTPLTSLRGYAEAMADGVVQPDQVASTGAVMVGESERLERIVADLLDLARMGAREVRIDAVATDVGPVLHEAAQVWSDLCAAEGVDFAAELPEPPQRLPTIVTDPVRLRQIVDNLLANALRMTPPGRPIVLAARGARDDGGEELLIEVRDGGPGLTDDDLSVAFEPAELYSRYRGVRQVGSGVGLALVGRLAQRLGGRALAGHAAEGGAAFLIELPLAGPPQVAEQAAAAGEGPRR